MIFNANHILVNEITNHHKVAVSNFSPLAKEDILLETDAVIKRGGTMVIDKTSALLPQYIQDLANSTPCTDLTGLTTVSDLKEEFYLTTAHIKKMGEIISIEDKKFVRLEEDYLKIFSNPKWVIYPVNKDEIEDAEMEELIEKKQFKQIDKNTFLTWY